MGGLIGPYNRYESMQFEDYSWKDYENLSRVKLLLQWSGFIAGWLVFMYYWVFLLWDADLVVIPSLTIGLLVYIVAFIGYDLVWRSRKRDYDAVIDLVYPPYWDLVMSVMRGERKKAQKAIEELSAYVPDPEE